MNDMQYLKIKSSQNLLRGTLHCNGDLSVCSPLVIVHGYFSANRNGPQRLFVELAKRLARQGFAVYRFDLSGMGESDGDIRKIRFSDHVNDVKAMIDYVSNVHTGQKVNIIAHSLGCNIALELLRFQPNRFGKTVFLAPFLTSDETLEIIFGKNGKSEITQSRYTYRRGLYSDFSFFEKSTANEFMAALCDVPFNIFVFAAENDQFIPIEFTREVCKETQNVKINYVADADHNFLEVHSDLIDRISNIFV